MAKLSIHRAGHIALVVALAAGVRQASAQERTASLVGVVRDTTGAPIPGVEVWLRGSDLYTHTADNGGFRLLDITPGEAKLTIRRLGFEPLTVDIKLSAGIRDTVVISLSMVAASLAGITIEEERATRSKRLLKGFWDRRTGGFGHFVTRDEIDAKDAHNFTELVRMTPGLNVITVGGRQSIRFRNGGVRGDCPPQYWLDGIRIDNAGPDEFQPGDLEGVELYNGIATIPPQFSPRVVSFGPKTCGAIVIWSRLPGT
ncbi:hypothetical protein BH09GEM1_BH09GEM1_14020 [soil metagenome]